MNTTKLLLHLYYEFLYERLEDQKHNCLEKIDKLLTQEIDHQFFGQFDQEKYAAYHDACLAFLEERIETYNPIGVQYVYDQTTTQDAFQLQLDLDWYDSRAEYKALLQAARAKARPNLSQDDLRCFAAELIAEKGAYPDQSILADYQASPALNKLPDYIVALAIEQVIR